MENGCRKEEKRCQKRGNPRVQKVRIIEWRREVGGGGGDFRTKEPSNVERQWRGTQNFQSGKRPDSTGKEYRRMCSWLGRRRGIRQLASVKEETLMRVGRLLG